MKLFRCEKIIDIDIDIDIDISVLRVNTIWRSKQSTRQKSWRSILKHTEVLRGDAEHRISKQPTR